MTTDEKPDAEFPGTEDWTYEDGYEAGSEDALAGARQDKTDMTLAAAILIALIAGALGFIFGMVI